MRRPQIQNRLHTQMTRCTAMMATCLDDARDNTRCRDVEIGSLARLMRVSAELGVALARLRGRRQIVTVTREGVPESGGSNGMAS